MTMLFDTVGRLRIAGICEGISYLLLLGIAMPLKYLAGLPEMVEVVGWVHGVLFITFVVALVIAWLVRRWSIVFAGLLFVAALVPFGPFIADHWLKKEQHSER